MTVNGNGQTNDKVAERVGQSPFIVVETTLESQKQMRVPRPTMKLYKELLYEKRREILEQKAHKASG